MHLKKYLALIIFLCVVWIGKSQIDVGVSSVDFPTSNSTLAQTAVGISFNLRNYGTTTLPQTHPDTVKFELIVGGVHRRTYTRPLNQQALAPGATEGWYIVVDFIAEGWASPGGSFTWCLRSSLIGDPNSANDQYCQTNTFTTGYYDLGVEPNSIVIKSGNTTYANGAVIPDGTDLDTIRFNIKNHSSFPMLPNNSGIFEIDLGHGTPQNLFATPPGVVAPGASYPVVLDCTPNRFDFDFPSASGPFDLCIITTSNGDPDTTNNGYCLSYTKVPPASFSSLSPNAGPIGTTVKLFGNNFSTTNIAVEFSPGVAATIVNSSATEIEVTVPAGAQTGAVTVISDNVPLSGPTYTVTGTAIHEITNVSPSAGPVGSTITITGTGFSTTPADHQVNFTGVTFASVTSSTTTELKVVVPNGAQDGRIEVILNGFSALSPDTFEITTAPVPDIHDFNPKSGAPTSTVTITGINFDPVASNNTVTFGTSLPATILSGNATQLVVEVPMGAITGPIEVGANGYSDQSDTIFTVITDPIITDFNPKNGPVATQVTIEGWNFSPTAANNKVFFGTSQTSTPIAAADGKKLIVEVPAGVSPGERPVSVEVNGITKIADETFSVDATSVEEYQGITWGKVYYQPGRLMLDLNNPASVQDLNLVLHSIDGKALLSHNISNNQSIQEEIAVDLVPGTYLITLTHKGQSVMAKKVVVSR